MKKYKLHRIDKIDIKHVECDVFDITVDENHSYVANNIIVHNSACSTRIQTGHGLPTLQSIIDCAKTDRDTLLIADGGIRNSGDIVKALAFGADFVMLGGMLSGHSESPGEVFYVNGERRKTFRGMASKEAQEDWRGKSNGTEGISTTVPFKGQLCDTLEDLHNGIRSGFSYSGARNVNELRAKMKYSVVSTNTVAENVPHAKK